MSDSPAVESPSFAAVEYQRLPPSVYVLGAVMVAIGIATFVLMSAHGRGGSQLYLFFYSIPANTAISVFPHEPVLIYFGKFANVWLCAASATAGTLVAGYLDHRVFVPILNHRKITGYKDSRWYRKATRYFMRYPFATLVVTGFTPIPFFPFKFLSFSIHYPLSRYLAALAVSRFPRYVILAWVGAVFGIPNWILIASVVVIFGLYAVRGGPALWRQWRARRYARLNRDGETT